MKIRTSFVTNSSSSSFIVVGVNAETYGDKFEKIKGENEWGEVTYGDVFELAETDYNDVISLINLDFENKSVKQMKKEFVKLAKERGVEVDLEDIKFDYGAYYDG